MGLCKKMCEVMQYVEYINIGIEEMIQILESKSNVRDYAIILHDKDMDTKPHYHIAIRFKNSQNFDYVAKWFGVESQFVGTVKGKWQDILKYLTHKNAPEKYQYNEDEVISNFDYKNEIEGKNLKYYIDKIDSGEIREYNQFEMIPIDIWAKNKTVIKNSLEYYKERIVMDKNRKINVVFIQGGTGSGKTSYAKAYCEENKFTYCVSSSSNDALQDYKGEDVLILDDLRENSFEFADMLKILDNHTNSSIKSRYNNKFFMGHTIIITSCLELKDWYTTETREDRNQLFRRIKLMLKLSDDGKKVTCYAYCDGKYANMGTQDNKYIDYYKKEQEDLNNLMSQFGFVPDGDLEYSLFSESVSMENIDKIGW